MDDEIIDNPINYRQLIWPGVTAIMVLIVSLAIIAWEDSFNIKAVIIAVPVSIFVFMISGCVWECFRRPNTVIITENEMILNMRYGRGKEYVYWKDIKYLNIFLVAEGTFKGRDGYLYYGKNVRRTLYRQIVLIAREKYKEKMGDYPPMLEGYYN